MTYLPCSSFHFDIHKQGKHYVNNLVVGELDFYLGFLPIGSYRSKNIFITKMNGQDLVFGVYSIYSRVAPKPYRIGWIYILNNN